MRYIFEQQINLNWERSLMHIAQWGHRLCWCIGIWWFGHISPCQQNISCFVLSFEDSVALTSSTNFNLSKIKVILHYHKISSLELEHAGIEIYDLTDMTSNNYTDTGMSIVPTSPNKSVIFIAIYQNHRKTCTFLWRCLVEWSHLKLRKVWKENLLQK